MSGILLVDKPKDWTSSDVCQFIKKRFHFNKVGHGGTLDPFATGLLIIYLDDATRWASGSLNDEKYYEGTIHFGIETTTGDPEGEVILRAEVPESVNEESIRNVFSSFTGTQMQTPPMMSAIKKNGIPLYRLARKGIEVSREPREIQIFELLLKSWSSPFAVFRSKVSKGTYIRVLAKDIGQKLGCPVSLTELRRIASGNFHIERSITVDQMKQMPSKEKLFKFLIQQEYCPK